MAEIAKFKSANMGTLFRHNNRTANDGVEHENTEIDKKRTIYNYHLKQGGVEEAKARLSEVFFRGNKGDVVLCEAVVTLPKEVESKDERAFFRACLDFFTKDFGDANIINAVVHKDETTPHIHIDFIPVVKGDVEASMDSNFSAQLRQWRKTHHGELERVCCKQLITRNYLRGMHGRLDKYVETRLGYKVGVLNGATIEGNRTVLQMKNEDLEAKIAEKENVLAHMEGEIKKLYVLARRCGFEAGTLSLVPLVERICILEKQSEVLQDIIRQNNFSFTREQLAELRNIRPQSAKSVPMNVFSDSIINAEIDETGIIVVESRESEMGIHTPQRAMFERFDMERPYRRFLASREDVLIQPSRETENVYLFIKANTAEQLLSSLLAMQRIIEDTEELEGRKIYMERLEMDEYDFARNVLEKSGREVMYFMNTRKINSEKVAEKEKA